MVLVVVMLVVVMPVLLLLLVLAAAASLLGAVTPHTAVEWARCRPPARGLAGW